MIINSFVTLQRKFHIKKYFWIGNDLSTKKIIQIGTKEDECKKTI